MVLSIVSSRFNTSWTMGAVAMWGVTSLTRKSRPLMPFSWPASCIEYRKIKRPFPPPARAHPVASPALPRTTHYRVPPSGARAPARQPGPSRPAASSPRRAASSGREDWDNRLGQLPWDGCNPLAYAATWWQDGCWARRWDTGGDHAHGRAARDGGPASRLACQISAATGGAPRKRLGGALARARSADIFCTYQR